MAELSNLGRYQLRRVLGRGAMGVVYDGYDPTIDRRVAVKVILKSQAIDEETARAYSVRFVREARAAGRLNHANIVQVYDFGEQEDIAYLVMEFIQGRELRSFFSAKEPFSIEESVRIMGELLSALDFAHEAGVIHRDVKPANVMLDLQRRAKLADFGVARIQDSERSAADTLVGTPAYMSPEQISGRKVDRRTDIFSTGSILYQFLTGEQPFKGEGTWTVAKQIMQDDPPPPSRVTTSVSPAFDNIVNKALAKDPAQRYANAREFADALRGALAGKPPAAVVQAPEPKARPAARVSEGEVEFWRSILNSTDPAEFEFYLEQFPEGTYAQLARYKIAKLRGTSATETEATVRIAQEERARQEAEAAARREADEKAKREALEKTKREAEETEKRKAAELRARQEAEAAARREADEKAKREALEKTKREAEETEKRKAAEKAKREAAERRQQEQAEARARTAVDRGSAAAAGSLEPEAPPPEARKKSYALPAAAAAAVLIAVGVGAYLFLGRTPAPVPAAQVPAPAAPPKTGISEAEIDKVRKETEARVQQEYADKLAGEQAAAKAAAEKTAQEKQLAMKAAAEKAATEKAAAQKAARDKLAAEKAAAEKAAAEKAVLSRVAAEKSATERAAAERAAAEKAAGEKAAAEKAAAEKAAAERAAAEKAAAEKAAAAKAGSDFEALHKQARTLEAEGKMAEAVRVYIQAARMGSGPAAKRLGDIYDRGAPGVSPDPVESIKWHNLARRRGIDARPADKR